MTTDTNPAFTDKDKAALEACSEFDKMFRATALQDQQSIVESLPNSFDHHWAWNSESVTWSMLHASPSMPARPSLYEKRRAASIVARIPRNGNGRSYTKSNSNEKGIGLWATTKRLFTPMRPKRITGLSLLSIALALNTHSQQGPLITQIKLTLNSKQTISIKKLCNRSQREALLYLCVFLAGKGNLPGGSRASGMI